MDIRLGDKIKTKKPHPCGGNIWTVTRIGADIKMKCDTCGREIMLPRVKAQKSIKEIIRKEEEVK